jgi:hypothetical protein
MEKALGKGSRFYDTFLSRTWHTEKRSKTPKSAGKERLPILQLVFFCVECAYFYQKCAPSSALQVFSV